MNALTLPSSYSFVVQFNFRVNLNQFTLKLKQEVEIQNLRTLKLYTNIIICVATEVCNTILHTKTSTEVFFQQFFQNLNIYETFFF